MHTSFPWEWTCSQSWDIIVPAIAIMIIVVMILNMPSTLLNIRSCTNFALSCNLFFWHVRFFYMSIICWIALVLNKSVWDEGKIHDLIITISIPILVFFGYHKFQHHQCEQICHEQNVKQTHTHTFFLPAPSKKDKPGAPAKTHGASKRALKHEYNTTRL